MEGEGEILDVAIELIANAGERAVAEFGEADRFPERRQGQVMMTIITAAAVSRVIGS